MGVVLGLIGMVILFWILHALNKQHVKTTGVPMPSRNAMRRVRRNAREKGISEQAAYEQWVSNKQKRLPKCSQTKTKLPEGRFTPSYNQADPTEQNRSLRTAFVDAFPRPPEPLSISIKSMAPQPAPSTMYDFEFEFHCTDCGGFIISREDEPSQRVTCKACGRYFGEYPEIKARCLQLGSDELVRRGLKVS